MVKPTKTAESSKPAKPRPDFPLFPHNTGRWCKKVKGRFVYFGKVADDPHGNKAIELWLEQRDELLAGRTPRTKPGGLTLRELLDRYMVSKRCLVDTCELSPRTFAELYSTCKRIGDIFGINRLVDDLASDDFERLRKVFAKTWGPVRLGNEIQRVRSVFKFGYEAGLIDKPVRFGPTFKKPSRKVLRLNRAKKGPKMFDADELRKIIDAAGVPLKAMILLGINCGFGNSDVSNLLIKAVDMKAGWIDFARPKTGIARRCPLWPETVAAIKDALEKRPKPKDKTDNGLMFITKYGGRWFRFTIGEPDEENGGDRKMYQDDPVTKEFTKIIKELKIHRPGLGFYSLRHTFETVAGDSKDQVAVDHIMGHAKEDMATLYREKIEDARLVAVTDHVHKWLFENEETT